MKSNQNLLIAQVVKFLNGNGCFVWRQENNGRIDEESLVNRVTDLLHALAHVKYDKDKISPLVKKIVRESYRPVPSGIRGVCDVIGFELLTGRWVAVEIKCGADQLRDDQKVFIDCLRRAGGDVWVVRDINSFRQAFSRKFQPVS